MKSSRTINESVNERLMKGWREGVVRGWIGNEQPTNKWWKWSVRDVWGVELMKLACAGCGGSAPLWYLFLYVILYTFMCIYMLSYTGNVRMMCKWWNREAWSVWGVWGVELMKLECVGYGGGAPLGICSFMWFYVLSCAFMYRQRTNDENEVCGMWWKCAPRYLFIYVRGLEVRP